MKITFERKDLLKGLKIGGSLAGKSKVMPILDCVKISVKGMTATFVSSDNENAISKKVPVLQSDFDCKFCVHLPSILSYVKLIASDNVEVLIHDDKTVEIKHEKGSIEFPYHNADEFPVITPDKESTEINVEAASIYNFINEGQKFTASDEFRPIMNGVYIYQEGENIGCCASDGMSLFTNEEHSAWGYSYSFVIGKNAFKTICEAISEKDAIQMRVGATNVMFVTEDCSVISRLQEGRYPNFRSVIPKANNIEFKVNRKDFINAVNRCVIAAQQASQLVKLSINGFTLEVSCEDIDFNTKSKELLTVEDGQDARIGFNCPKLMNILNSIFTDNVIVSMRNESSAAIFRNDTENDKSIYLLMPMMLKD